MKFTIFKWWESWVKPLIYIVMLAATAGLILGYCFIKDDGGTLAFAVSISYALVLFLVTIPINKIDNYTAEKLYERETFYLTLKRLRDVTNSTIQKADKKDFKSLREHIIAFQIFTGREANMIEERLQGKKVPVYIKEKGVTYSLEMQLLETEFLKLYDEADNKKKLAKCAKKLCKCYKKGCKRLEYNYSRIAQVYGGALFDLIERDATASDAEYSLSDIGSKVDDLVMELSSLRSDIDELSSEVCGNQKYVFNDHNQLAEKLMDIEDILLDLQNAKSGI